MKVHAAELSLSRGQTTAACGHLAAFMNEVGAQSGKRIPVPRADQLIAAAARIRTSSAVHEKEVPYPEQSGRSA